MRLSWTGEIFGHIHIHLVEYIVILDGLVRKEFDRAFPKWSERYQKVFKTIKKIITEAKCLAIIDYNFRETIYIITDTSLIETGAI